MIECTIEKLVHGGNGLARTPDGICFVQGALPNEVVIASFLGKVGGIPQYAAHQIVEPSAQRVIPFCKYAGKCGGCFWQHIDPSYQSQQKVLIFKDCLERIGKIENDSAIELFTAPWENYRIRAQFQIDIMRRRVGFCKKYSNDVIAIDSCPLCAKPLNDLLKNEDVFLNSHTESIKLLCGDSNIIASAPTITGTHFATTITVGPKQFHVHGDSFFQSNKHLTKTLSVYVSKFIVGKNLLDLYSGIGFFPITSDKHFDSVCMVESAPGCKDLTLKNCQINNLDNVTFFEQDVAFFCTHNLKNQKTPDTVIIDPPRLGLSKEARRAIGQSGIQRIISVSCDPATHARDVGYLVNSCGYTISAMALFDMYPHTFHSETVVILNKIKK